MQRACLDESNKQVLGADTSPAHVAQAIDDSLERLQRDTIDLLLHLDDLDMKTADILFHEMQSACRSGKVQSFGWSAIRTVLPSERCRYG